MIPNSFIKTAIFLLICLITFGLLPAYATGEPAKGEMVMTKDLFDHKNGQFVSCNGAKIYVEEIGNAKAPVLLLLHGGFGTIEDFNKITPFLSDKFRLIGIDSRGHGRSQLGTDKLSYKLLTDDLTHIVDVLKLKEFHIFGFSDGGIVAYRYALKQDPRLFKIVTVGASWEMSENDPAWGMISGMTADAWKEMFPASYDHYMRLNPAPDFNSFAAAVVGMWTDLSSEGHPGESVAQVKNEMLVIRGDKDPLTSADSMSKLARMLSNVKLLNIPLAEHVAFDDAPEIFFDNFSKFLNVDPISFRETKKP